jgi:anaerobic magnesium-protoporphyrin IX monomethyl ester cyclase
VTLIGRGDSPIFGSLDILFVNLPPVSPDLSRVADATSASHLLPPLGILYLADSISRCASVGSINCVDFATCDLEAFAAHEELESFVVTKMRDAAGERAPSVVAVSLAFSSSYDFFQTVCRAVSRSWSDVTVVVGGVHASNTVTHCLESNPIVDYVICGEGEEAFPELLEAIAGGMAPDIPGVHSRRSIKRGLKTPFEATRHVETLDIDFTIFPKLIDMDVYTQKTALFSLSKTSLEVRSFSVMASRGCPGRCTFCASHTVHGRRPRWRSLENVLAEIRWLNAEFGVTKVYLMDDNLVPKEKALGLFSALADSGIPGLEVIIQNLSIRHTDHDVIDAVVKAGTDNIAYAIESGSTAVQKRIGKNVDLEKACDIVAYSQSKGLNVRCFYMVGFPGESVAEMNETFDYAKRLGADWSTFSVAVPLPGSGMYAEFVSQGVIEDGPKTWRATSIRDRVFDTPEIGAEDIKSMAYRANLDVNFVHNSTIRSGDYANAKVIFTNFIRAFDFHVFAHDCLRRIALHTGDSEGARAAAVRMKQLLETDQKSQLFKAYFDLLDDEIRAYLES